MLYGKLTLACQGSQVCSELGPAQPQLVLSIVVISSKLMPAPFVSPDYQRPKQVTRTITRQEEICQRLWLERRRIWKRTSMLFIISVCAGNGTSRDALGMRNFANISRLFGDKSTYLMIIAFI